jgi:hypothetical protein
MNIMRIVPARESREWVARMFQEGPHPEPNAPDYPLTFPLPAFLGQSVEGGFLYVVYDGEVIGYGKIAEVVEHSGDPVGGEDNHVPPGNKLVIDGPLKRMPFFLSCRGFRRFRYVSENLHTLDKSDAAQVIRGMNL